MTEALVEGFLAEFDDSRFPADFLQRYELMECLAQNELGETLLVKDRQTGEVGVAKCYPDKTLLSRATESDLLKKLHHAGLPAYLGEYQNEKMLCVVRAFAPGRPLDRLAREAPLDRRQAVDIAVQLCDILSCLHGQKPPIIHRDIKPQNIILDEQGKITLIDFGISRTYDEASAADTLSWGTRHYAAPEQYGFSQTDGRSDIFSLGVLLGWMLTGSADARQAGQTIPDLRLARIVRKCAAFAPQDRYKNAAQVREALTGRALRRRALAFLGAALILLAALLAFPQAARAPGPQPGEVIFAEPLIEQAVRLSLGMAQGETIREQELAAVQELFVFGDHVAVDRETFDAYTAEFANNGGSLQRGGIRTLEDLSKLKNLRQLSLVYQDIRDLGPISGLALLEAVDLHHNPIEDAAPLGEVESLTSICLFDTLVADLTALRGLPRLTHLDIGMTRITALAALDGLDALRVLAARRAPLESLEGIETHPQLEEIYLGENPLWDLSPLLDLPDLQRVEVDEALRPAAEAIAGQARFKIVYP